MSDPTYGVPEPVAVPVASGPEPEKPDSYIPLWAIVTAIAVMLAGAGVAAYVVLGGVLETKEKHHGISFPASWDPRVAPYVKVVEKQRGLRFMHPVTVRFLPDKAFEKTVTADEKDLDKNDRKEIEQQTGLMRAVGLLAGDVDLFAAMNDATGAGTLAYYSFEKKDIVIRGTALTLAVHATLVHELTHALQDQYFDISTKQVADAKKADERDGAGGTAASVFDAIVEGDAERVANKYRQSLPRAQRQALAKAEDRDTQDADKAYTKIPRVVLTLMSSPYTLGQAMVNTIAEDGGNAAVDALFRDPPTHEAALLDPLEVIEGRTGAKKVPAPALADGEKKIAADEFGALTWFFVLGQRMPLKDALAAADGWNGDQYVAFDRQDTTCARIDVATDSSADATRFLGAVRRWIAEVPGTPASVKKRGALVRFESCDPGKKANTGKDDSTDALTLVTVRGQLGAEFVKQGAPVKVARCLSERSVQEFPISTLTASKISDADTARLRGLARECAGQ
ncbi:MAG: hypothetical protein J7518_11485 [Nocardioidaceae bacterium]|nr:hypothetical protein [Nocardioidaceae bacterium]